MKTKITETIVETEGVIDFEVYLQKEDSNGNLEEKITIIKGKLQIITNIE
jgi:hypothetical protein